MTVKELKDFLENQSDNKEIVIHFDDSKEFILKLSDIKADSVNFITGVQVENAGFIPITGVQFGNIDSNPNAIHNGFKPTTDPESDNAGFTPITKSKDF